MIITIQDEKNTAVIDSLGAQLISLKDGSQKEYIWQRDPDVWAKCSPLLFPSVGNSRNNQTIIEGTWYPMPKHGFCKDTDFDVITQDANHAVFQITSSETTKTMYPYEFKLTLSYTLNHGTLNMDYTVTNQDGREICYAIGAHPGFRCPLEEGAAFEDYILEFEHTEDAQQILYNPQQLQFERSRHKKILDNTNTIHLDYSLFLDDAIYIEELKSRKVSLLHTETRKGVEVAFPDFDTVAFWTPGGIHAPLICVEPWNGSAIFSDEDDEFKHKHHIQHLQPSEAKTYHMGIRMIY